MGKEIERKFLVANNTWRDGATRHERLRQAYLAFGPPVSVRVRIGEKDAKLNIKKSAQGMERDEFEYEIPVEDARQLLEGLCAGETVEKVRYHVPQGTLTWEIDVFEGNNQGLIIAEIELKHADQQVDLPEWVGAEVTCERKYYNSQLAQQPFSKWSD